MPQVLDAMVAEWSLLSAGARIVPLPNGAKQVMQAVVDSLPTAAWRAELDTVAEK